MKVTVKKVADHLINFTPLFPGDENILKLTIERLIKRKNISFPCEGELFTDETTGDRMVRMGGGVFVADDFEFE